MVEVPRELQRLFQEEFTVWDAATLRKLPRDILSRLGSVVVDVMGVRSAESQGLGAPITSVRALLASEQQRLYVCSTSAGQIVVGILKVGVKTLFLRVSSEQNGLAEAAPLCVLDIYVDPDRQRVGLGHRMFEHMLACEHAEAWQLAYDRPSPKLQGFLRKHYALTDYIPQANNYMVFARFFRERHIPTLLPFVSTPLPPQPSIITTTASPTSNSSSGRSPALTLPSPSVTPTRSRLRIVGDSTSSPASSSSWPWGSPDIPQSRLRRGQL